MVGTQKSLGVLYVDLLQLFDRGAFITSWVSTVMTLAWCFSCMSLHFLHQYLEVVSAAQTQTASQMFLLGD